MHQYRLTIPHVLTEKRITKARLPTNTTTHRHPIHRWFNFIAGFSPEFVNECCNQLTQSDDLTLLDPFAGCATAPLVACQRGIHAVGYEPHPVFWRVGRAKLFCDHKVEEVRLIENVIRTGLAKPRQLTSLPPAPRHFLLKLFPENILSKLLGAREAITDASLLNNDLAFLILSHVLERSTHSQTDGIYKAPTSTKRSISPEMSLENIIRMVENDLAQQNEMFFKSFRTIYPYSSAKMAQTADDSISIIVTSPPYLNNFDYAEMTRMHLYFWGLANSWAEITEKVRTKLVVNTTTALKGHKDRQKDYRKNIAASVLPELEKIIALLSVERSKRAGKKDYHLLVLPYFSQMTKILMECLRCLGVGAPIHIMVADAALYGVHISTPQILSQIMRDLGYKTVKCDFVRKRGHRWILDKRDGSKKGLGEYYIHGNK